MKTANQVANEWEVFVRKYKVPEFKDLIDNTLVIFKIFTIDIIKFDIWLHKKFGNYENNNKSMEDILKEKYGDDIANYVKQMILISKQ